MTVYEVVKKYGLEDYSKHYKTVIGNSCDCRFPLDKLAELPVKSISINFPTKEVEITLNWVY